jgi:methionine-rich copper-binding protein CopC
MNRRRALARAAVIMALVGAAGLGAATTASAHNILLSTDPANGSQVATLPAGVTLTFNEPALAIGSVMRVVGPGGDVAAGPPVLVDRTVKEAIRPGSPAGAYTVQWRVTSLDGHPISGQFSFTAAAGSAGSATGATGAGTGVTGTGSSTAQSPADSGSGSAKPLILILIVAGVLVVGAGAFLAIRRPGPTLAADEVPVGPAGAAAGPGPAGKDDPPGDSGDRP